MSNSEPVRTIKFRPLDKVMQLASALSQEVTYAYDDLVFIGYSEIVIQMNDDSPDLYIYIHQDISETDRGKIIDSFKLKAGEMQIPLFYKGTYKIEEKTQDSQIDIVFNSQTGD